MCAEHTAAAIGPNGGSSGPSRSSSRRALCRCAAAAPISYRKTLRWRLPAGLVAVVVALSLELLLLSFSNFLQRRTPDGEQRKR
jgi:hypothetical protein